MAQTVSGLDRYGREIVLGLVVEQPSHCYELDRRLAKRFGSADYAQGMASKTIKRLLSEGLVSPVEGGRLLATGTAGRADVTVYEATPAGVKRFREWMWASVAAPPVREELHAKIALCRPTDMPRMIAHVREAETICVGKLRDLNREVQARRRDTDPEDWSTRMDVVVSTGDQVWWESRIKWLQEVHLYLEKDWQRYQSKLRAHTVARQMA
jgi:DNA-binding PadR family transcriptional regulator